MQEKTAEQQRGGHTRPRCTLAWTAGHRVLYLAKAGLWTGAARAIPPSYYRQALTCQQDTREGDAFRGSAGPGAASRILPYPHLVTSLQLLYEVAGVEGCATTRHLGDRSGNGIFRHAVFYHLVNYSTSKKFRSRSVSTVTLKMENGVHPVACFQHHDFGRYLLHSFSLSRHSFSSRKQYGKTSCRLASG